jgi:hypothetical protein
MIMEQSYGSDLDWFFQQWIYGKGYPVYNYSWTYKPDGNHFVIDLSLQQVQSESGSDEVFTMPLDLVILQFPHFATDTLQIWNDKRIQSFKIITDLEPQTLELDPRNWVLKKSQEVSSVDDQDQINAYTYLLEQNYPNPFNPVTRIDYQLSLANEVNLSIYNILGQKVVTLISERQIAGAYQIKWDASKYPTGIYYYVIKSGDFQAVKKMIYMK